MNSGDNYIGGHAIRKAHDVSKEEWRVILEHTSRSEKSPEVAALRRPESRLESNEKTSMHDFTRLCTETTHTTQIMVSCRVGRSGQHMAAKNGKNKPKDNESTGS